MKEAEFFGAKTIGIIGGKGGMGTLFSRIFGEAGIRVIVSDLDTELANETLAAEADVVILSVPMETAVALAGTIGPLLREDQVFVDFSSLKSEVMTAMETATRAHVLGIHPMFGQYTDSLVGQNLLFCESVESLWSAAFESFFEAQGATVTRMDADTHDRHMAFVQSVTHLVTIATGAYLKENGWTPGTADAVSTPIFRMNLDFVGRLFALDLGLYEDLVGRNPFAGEVIEAFCQTFRNASGVLLEGDASEKRAYMEAVRDYLGGFSKDALAGTNRILSGLADSRKST